MGSVYHLLLTKTNGISKYNAQKNHVYLHVLLYKLLFVICRSKADVQVDISRIETGYCSGKY